MRHQDVRRKQMKVIKFIVSVFDFMIGFRSLLGLTLTITLIYLVNEYIPNDLLARILNTLILIFVLFGSYYWDWRHRKKYRVDQ